MEQDYNDACADFNDAMIEYNASLAQLKDPVTGEVSLEALKDVVKPVSSLGALRLDGYICSRSFHVYHAEGTSETIQAEWTSKGAILACDQDGG